MKIALELNLEQAEQLQLFMAIAAGLSTQQVKEAPKAEAPKAEAPKAEAPKAEAPKAEAPKAEAPKAEAPKAEAPKAEAPKAEAPKAEAPTGVTMVDLVAKAQALVKSDGANQTTYGQQMRAWMTERGHVGRIPELPKDLWAEFNAYIDTISA